MTYISCQGTLPKPYEEAGNGLLHSVSTELMNRALGYKEALTSRPSEEAVPGIHSRARWRFHSGLGICGSYQQEDLVSLSSHTHRALGGRCLSLLAPPIHMEASRLSNRVPRSGSDCILGIEKSCINTP